MNVKINGNLYENVEWDNGILTIYDDNLTIAQAEEEFIPGEDTDEIEFIQDGETTSKVYNRGINYIALGRDPRRIEVSFITSEISKTAEERIQEALNNHADIMDTLTQQYNDLLENKDRWNSMASVIDAHAQYLQDVYDQMNELLAANGPLVLLEERLNHIESLLPHEETPTPVVAIPTSADAVEEENE